MHSHIEIAPIGRRIPLMDYLKGFSILTILMVHLVEVMQSLPPIIHTMSAVGGGGVHVFFLCSGIGLYTSYLNHRTGYCEFLKKRFLKIYIPYILIVFLSFLLPWMYLKSDRLTALFSHIFLFKMFVPRYEESFGVHFWYISTLFQLYALFIPMCRIKKKLNNSKLFFGTFLSISILWWIFCYMAGIGHIRIWGSFCLQNIWEFALGFVLAEAFYAGKSFRIKNIHLLLLALGGISIQAGMVLLSDSLKVFNDIPGLVGYTSLALFFSNLPFVKTLCSKLSSFSYELYLIHVLILRTVFHFVQPQGFVMDLFWAAVSAVLSVAAAYGYHSLIRSISRRH